MTRLGQENILNRTLSWIKASQSITGRHLDKSPCARLLVQGAALPAQLGGAAGRRGRIFGQWSAPPILFAEKGGKKCANFGA